MSKPLPDATWVRRYVALPEARRARAYEALESAVEREGVKALEGLGYEVRKDGRQGWPDRLVLVGRNVHFWWEVKKRKGGRLTPAQKRVIPRLRARGETVLVRPTLEELLDTAGALRVRSIG